MCGVRRALVSHPKQVNIVSQPLKLQSKVLIGYSSKKQHNLYKDSCDLVSKNITMINVAYTDCEKRYLVIPRKGGPPL